MMSHTANAETFSETVTLSKERYEELLAAEDELNKLRASIDRTVEAIFDMEVLTLTNITNLEKRANDKS